METLERIVHAHDQADDGLWLTVLNRLRQKNHQLPLDAGTARQLMAYIRRLQYFEAENRCDFGGIEQIVDIAIKQIIGNAFDAQPKRGRR
jgi:hypothetical protein